MGTIRRHGSTYDWNQARANDEFRRGEPEAGWQGPVEPLRETLVGDRDLEARERSRGYADEHRERVDDRPLGSALMNRLGPRRRGVAQAGDLMTRQIRGVRPNDTMQHVAQIMVDEDTGIVPVLGAGNRLLGVVTDRDIVCRLIPRGIDVREMRATDAMTRDVECVTEEMSVYGVLRVMRERQVRRVPVVTHGDRLVGIISMADIVREADVDYELQQTLEQVSTDRGYWTARR